MEALGWCEKGKEWEEDKNSGGVGVEKVPVQQKEN
jgi:hypothetical protein